MNLAELNVALNLANQLFPFFAKIVRSVEDMAPHAPGPTKLDAAMAMTQNALATASTDATAVAGVVSMAPAMIALAKAQYNAAPAVPSGAAATGQV